MMVINDKARAILLVFSHLYKLKKLHGIKKIENTNVKSKFNIIFQKRNNLYVHIL